MRRIASLVLMVVVLSSVLAAPASAQSIAPVTPVNPIRLGQDLIVNGGFESNGGLPWWLSSSNATIDKVPHHGCLSLRLGGYGNGSAYYRLTLPNNLPEAKLSFWLQVQSNETTSNDRGTWRAGDYLEMQVLTPSLTYTEYWYPRNPSQQRGVWQYEYIWHLRQDAGQTVDISFKAFANSTNATWFFIDDVALTTGLVVYQTMAFC
jgi:hypothetical protein